MGFFKPARRVAVPAISVLVLFGILGYVLIRYNQSPPLSQPATVSRLSPLPTNQHTPTPTVPTFPTSSILCQKIYHSTGGHFSICVPSDWNVSQYGNPPKNPTPNTNMEITPPNEPELSSETMTIYAQLGAANFLQEEGNMYASYAKTDWFSNINTQTTKIAGYTAREDRYVWKTTPAPDDTSGENANETDKNIFIDLGNNNKIVDTMKWSNENPQFESIFDIVLSSLTIDK